MQRRGSPRRYKRDFFPWRLQTILSVLIGFLFGVITVIWFDQTSGEMPLTEACVSDNNAGGKCAASAMAVAEKYAKDAESVSLLRTEKGPLHIAAFVRMWVPPLHSAGGMQFHAFHIYSQLAARGHRVRVFTTGPPSDSYLKRLAYCTDPQTHMTALCDESDPNARMIVQPVSSLRNGEYSVSWYKATLAAYRKIHAVTPFDVAHSESWAAVPNAAQLGIPLSVTWHGSMFDWFRNEMNFIAHTYRHSQQMPEQATKSRMEALAHVLPMEEYALLTVSQHIVISDSAEADLLDIHQVQPERIARIYNGVNRHLFRPRTEAGGAGVRAAFLQSHGVSPDNFIVGCGGRLVAIKGHNQMAEAMRRVLTQHKDVTLLVAGTGPLEKVYKKMRNSGLSVVLLKMMSQKELALFYQSIDVFVDPFYQYHGLNTVMVEAALSGVPLVVTALSSARSVVPCDDFGRKFTLGDVDGIAREVLYYKFHPKERDAVARRAHKRAQLLFGSDTMAGQYEALLYRMHENPPPIANLTGKVVCLAVYPAMCYREVN